MIPAMVILATYFRVQIRPQRFQQTLGQTWRVENCAQQQQTAPRIFLARGFEQQIAHFRIAYKALRTLQQPNIQLTFGCAQVRG